MDLVQFVTASIDKKAPNNFPVSHPERGFSIITNAQWGLWEQWGWAKESWDVVVDKPVAAKPKRRTRKPKTEE